MPSEQKTPLNEKHKNTGAKMTLFAGWEMPVSFGSIIEEHKAVRQRAGLFDISHMGQIVFQGPHAAQLLEQVFSRRLADMPIGHGRYGLLLTEAGTVVDDIITYRIAEEEFLAVVNASRVSNDIAHITKYCGPEILRNESNNWSALALQGPLAIAIWEKCSSTPPPPRFGISKFSTNKFCGYLARTGYTGEDGVEIIVPSNQIEKLWDELVALGAAPCGLGARDSLRIEAGYPLYGHELGENLTALESGAGWAVDFSKTNDWLGAEVLRKQKTDGPPRRLVFLSALEPRAIPREGYTIYHGDEKIGHVTSGVHSPTLGCGIGMAIINSPHWQIGGEFGMEIRGRRAKVRIEKKPAYRRNNT